MPAMIDDITTEYNDEINAIVVRMPDAINFDTLKKWQNEFLSLIKEKSQGQRLSLLFDSNTHNFESIECLKLLRELLSYDAVVKENISRVAFVTPRKYREPGIISEYEAYFENRNEAYMWIKSFEIL